MATTPSRLTFHFPVAASPDKILILLRVLAQADEPILTSEDIDRLAFDLSSHKNRFTDARILAQHVLGLIDETAEGLQLTPPAQVILQKREPAQYDLLHYLFSTAWKPEGSAQHHARSWLYQTIGQHLWGIGQVQLDPQVRQELTQQITNQAGEDFQSVPGFSSATFSVGRQTMDGAIEWLKHLKPPVLEIEGVGRNEEGGFARRSACSGELFLLALSRSYQMSGSEAGTDLLLSPQRRDEVSRLCLLEPLQFDRMLDWVLPLFPQFIAPGTRAGAYGRFVRLYRFVAIEELDEHGPIG